MPEADQKALGGPDNSSAGVELAMYAMKRFAPSPCEASGARREGEAGGRGFRCGKRLVQGLRHQKIVAHRGEAMHEEWVEHGAG